MSVSFGPQFAPDEAFMRWGWERVMATTDIPFEMSEAAYPNWRAAFVSGDPRRERNVMREAFGSLDFRWYWLEESFQWIQRVIEPVHGWPYTWRTPIRKSLRLPKYRVDLLGGEIAGAVYQARSREAYATSRQRKGGPNLARELVLVSGWGCPAEDAVARLFVDRFRAGDGTSWPPFFPGDRTSLRFEVFRHPATPNEIARCPASMVEPLWPLPTSTPFPTLPVN